MEDDIVSRIICKSNFPHLHQISHVTLCATDQCVNIGALSDEVDVGGVRPLVKRLGHVEPRKPLVRVHLQVGAIFVHG